jgi:uncharacterized protein YciI
MAATAAAAAVAASSTAAAVAAASSGSAIARASSCGGNCRCCCGAAAFSSTAAFAYTAVAPAHPFRRSLHTAPVRLIVAAGSSGRARARKLAERAQEAAVLAAQRVQEERTGSKLKALLRARAEAEEAEHAAQLSAQYRKPHIKRRGRTFEANQRLLDEVDEQQAEAEAEAEEEAEAKAQAEAQEQGEADTSSVKRPMFPLDLSRTPEEAAAAAAASPTPAPLLASVEAQLRSLDASPALRHNAGGLGFDSIRLESTEVLPSEVFEDEDGPGENGSMRRLRADRDRRPQLKRVERVTERTREIVGRVLLEESVKIGSAQEAYRAAGGGSSAISKSLHQSTTMSLMDLRTLSSSFTVHECRYSTDLAWLQVRWTLAKEGFAQANDAEAEAQRTREQHKAKRGKRARATAAAAAAAASESGANNDAGPTAPPVLTYAAAKAAVVATLAHVLPSVRFALGRELDLRYTPSVRFVYDEAREQRQEREALQEKQAERDHAILSAAFGFHKDQVASPSPAATAASRLSQLAAAKSSLLGLSSTSDLDLELGGLPAIDEAALDAAINDPAARAADLEMARQFDEHKMSRLPKRKQQQMAKRAAERALRMEKQKKKKALLADAHRLVQGARQLRDVPTLEADPFAALDPSRGTHPQELRRQLQATLSKLMAAKSAPAAKGAAANAEPEIDPATGAPVTPQTKREREALRLRQIADTRRSMSMLQQLQSLQRKADIDPVQQLKDKMKKERVKQYPTNFKALKNQFYRR